MMPEPTTFSYPTLIRFGVGVRREISEHLRLKKFERVLIVTDQGLMQTTIPNEISNLLKNLNPTIFSGVFGNPTQSQVQAGIACFRTSQSQAIVALGGGAAVDVAKAIALMVHHPGELFDYEDGKSNARPVDRDIPYLVALPTTSGTGSEVGRSTVISDDKTKIKKIIFSPRLLPSYVFADPELTVDLPPAMTAATGMDALTHLVESFLAKGFHPMCEGIALEGLGLVARHLKRAVEHPRDIHARGMMLMASMMGAVAFQKGLGVTHSCAHALSTVCNLHHGLANGIMVPYAMQFNLENHQEKFLRLAHAVGLTSEKPEKFVAWLKDLQTAIGIPGQLKPVGVDRGHLSDLVSVAIKDVCHQSNPRVVTEKDFETLFLQALG